MSGSFFIRISARVRPRTTVALSLVESKWAKKLEKAIVYAEQRVRWKEWNKEATTGYLHGFCQHCRSGKVENLCDGFKATLPHHRVHDSDIKPHKDAKQ